MILYLYVYLYEVNSYSIMYVYGVVEILYIYIYTCNELLFHTADHDGLVTNDDARWGLPGLASPSPLAIGTRHRMLMRHIRCPSAFKPACVYVSSGKRWVVRFPHPLACSVVMMSC